MSFIPGHWNPVYFRDRLLRLAFELTRPDCPWLTRSAISFLGSWIAPQHTGLEWGSGRSTIWFAQRMGHLISVEHNSKWYQKIKRRLDRKKLTNVTCLLKSEKGGLESEYVRAADFVPQGSLDFVLVDGIWRDHCALKAVSLVKPGGILMIDNINLHLPSTSRSPLSLREGGAESPAWEQFAGLVKHWPRTWISDGVADTAWWVRPPT